MKKIKSYGDKGQRFPMKSPFLLMGYHKDAYPIGNEKMEPIYYIEGRQKGQDFNPDAPWRMYHGDKVPGFPAHPHRGFETVTIVEEGYIDHSDSLGGKGRYGKGDVQWLTAGKGVQHCEMFPLLNDDKENPFEIFQIWMNLSKQNKMVEPHYKMLWNEEIPIYEEDDRNGRKTKIRIIHGEYGNKKLYQSTPDSWAANSNHDVRILLVSMEANAEFDLKSTSKTASRMLYYYKGKGLMLEDVNLPHQEMYAELLEDTAIHIKNGDHESRFMVLEGNAIDEPVSMYGPFVMNTEEEILQAFNDFKRTEFGGWKWKDYDPVHDRNAGRFAEYTNGEKAYPPQKGGK